MNKLHPACAGVLAVFASALAPWAACAADAPQLRYAKPIEAPKLESEELLAISLDGEVFAATQDGFADLRVLDAGGRDTPFLLRAATETRRERVRRTWSPADPQVQLLDDQGLEITVQLAHDDPAPLGIKLITPVRDFEQRVSVFASPDGENWTAVVKDGLIFDYSRFIDVRNDSLEFPAATAEPRDGARRYLRIAIDDVTQEQQSQLMELTRRFDGADETNRSERVVVRREPFRIDRIEFWGDQQHQRTAGPRRTQYAVDTEPAREDVATQTIVNFSAHRQPITSLRVQTADRNFSRRARVEALRTRGEKSSWEPLGAATISRIDFRELQRESVDVAIPESRDEQMRLIIEDGDSAPLTIDGVEATGPVYEVVFLAEPGARYRLAYGNPAIGPASYDTAAISESLAADYAPASASLGKSSVLSTATPEAGGTWMARALNNPNVLTVAIAALAVMLAIGLYRASRRVAELPE